MSSVILACVARKLCVILYHYLCLFERVIVFILVEIGMDWCTLAPRIRTLPLARTVELARLFTARAF
uniref:Uncharacterized protein n=1 Tax=Arundo donax TaxID=35708 RepID=A0A0A9BEU0_ARUDO